jgi:hypothetical protein
MSGFCQMTRKKLHPFLLVHMFTPQEIKISLVVITIVDTISQLPIILLYESAVEIITNC